uniref:Uncharacterized protein n=1 Tax=Heliothis virescens TaxID=7102 RepID=A0A2A4J5E7_HELVI
MRDTAKIVGMVEKWIYPQQGGFNIYGSGLKTPEAWELRQRNPKHTRNAELLISQKRAVARYVRELGTRHAGARSMPDALAQLPACPARATCTRSSLLLRTLGMYRNMKIVSVSQLKQEQHDFYISPFVVHVLLDCNNQYSALDVWQARTIKVFHTGHAIVT